MNYGIHILQKNKTEQLLRKISDLPGMETGEIPSVGPQREDTAM